MSHNLNPIRLIKRYNQWVDKQHWVIQFVLMLSLVFAIRTFIFGLYWVPTGSMENTMLVGESFFADKLTLYFTPIKRGEIISFNEPTFCYSNDFFPRLFQKYIYGPQNWTKRVIGIPGDRVQGKIEAGRPVVYLNGEKLDEPYVNTYPVVNIQEISHQLTPRLFTGALPFFEQQSHPRFRSFDPTLPFCDVNQQFYCIDQANVLPHSSFPLILLPRTPSYNLYGPDADIFDVTLGEKEYFVMGDNRQASFDSRGWGRLPFELIHGRIIFRLFSFDTANSLVYELLTSPLQLLKRARSWSRWFSKVH